MVITFHRKGPMPKKKMKTCIAKARRMNHSDDPGSAPRIIPAAAGIGLSSKQYRKDLNDARSSRPNESSRPKP